MYLLFERVINVILVYWGLRSMLWFEFKFCVLTFQPTSRIFWSIHINEFHLYVFIKVVVLWIIFSYHFESLESEFGRGSYGQKSATRSIRSSFESLGADSNHSAESWQSDPVPTRSGRAESIFFSIFLSSYFDHNLSYRPPNEAWFKAMKTLKSPL